MTPATLKLRSAIRTVFPTLLPPPKSFWFIAASMTMTDSGFASAALSHPEPYWNGMLNIGKKSLKTRRIGSRNGRTLGDGGKTNIRETNVPVCRVGTVERMSARMSRYVSCGGSDLGSSATYARDASQL